MNVSNLKKMQHFTVLGKKWIYHSLKFKKPLKTTVLFIFGCQRSGTTLLTSIFENDLNMKVYGEFSKLSSNGTKKIRLNSLPLVKKELNRNRVSGIVLKPIVESQNALSLLEYFENSRALWIYRHYKAVAMSNVKRFGEKNGINNLRAVIRSEKANWRAEGVSNHTKDIVRHFYSDRMDPFDAAALFWFVRNRFFFELGLNKNPVVMICKYNDLVFSPAKVVNSIYEFISCEYPGDKIVNDVHTGSTDKGKDIELSPEIDAICREILNELDAAYDSGKTRWYSAFSRSDNI